MSIVEGISQIMRLLLLPNIAIGIVCISAILVITVRKR